MFSQIILVWIAQYFKVKINLVNSDHMLPCIVLLHSSEEALGEEEPREPERARGSVLNPLLHELESG